MAQQYRLKPPPDACRLGQRKSVLAEIVAFIAAAVLLTAGYCRRQLGVGNRLIDPYGSDGLKTGLEAAVAASAWPCSAIINSAFKKQIRTVAHSRRTPNAFRRPACPLMAPIL